MARPLRRRRVLGVRTRTACGCNNETGARTELNSVGFWFADPKEDDGCLGGGSPTTQFDGDASAGSNRR